MDYLSFRNTNVNHTPGGVTIVRVGGGGGNRTDTVVGSSRTDISLPSRDLAIFQPHTSNSSNVGKFGHKYQKHSDTSRSTGRLVTASNRSMPRLNACEYNFLIFEIVPMTIVCDSEFFLKNHIFHTVSSGFTDIRKENKN